MKLRSKEIRCFVIVNAYSSMPRMSQLDEKKLTRYGNNFGIDNIPSVDKALSPISSFRVELGIKPMSIVVKLESLQFTIYLLQSHFS